MVAIFLWNRPITTAELLICALSLTGERQFPCRQVPNDLTSSRGKEEQDLENPIDLEPSKEDEEVPGRREEEAKAPETGEEVEVEENLIAEEPSLRSPDEGGVALYITECHQDKEEEEEGENATASF